MRCSFHADVSCLITFTNEQWAFILEAFKSHYDIGLKMDIVEGGWLYGLNNQRTFAIESKENPDEIELQFSFRQVDKVIKSLEMHVQYSDSITAKELDTTLRKVITLLYAASTAANLVLKPLNIDNV